MSDTTAGDEGTERAGGWCIGEDVVKTCQVRAVIDGPLPEDVCTYIIGVLGLNMEDV